MATCGINRRLGLVLASTIYCASANGWGIRVGWWNTHGCAGMYVHAQKGMSGVRDRLSDVWLCGSTFVRLDDTLTTSSTMVVSQEHNLWSMPSPEHTQDQASKTETKTTIDPHVITVN